MRSWLIQKLNEFGHDGLADSVPEWLQWICDQTVCWARLKQNSTIDSAREQNRWHEYEVEVYSNQGPPPQLADLIKTWGFLNSCKQVVIALGTQPRVGYGDATEESAKNRKNKKSDPSRDHSGLWEEFDRYWAQYVDGEDAHGIRFDDVVRIGHEILKTLGSTLRLGKANEFHGEIFLAILKLVIPVDQELWNYIEDDSHGTQAGPSPSRDPVGLSFGSPQLLYSKCTKENNDHLLQVLSHSMRGSVLEQQWSNGVGEYEVVAEPATAPKSKRARKAGIEPSVSSVGDSKRKATLKMIGNSDIKGIVHEYKPHNVADYAVVLCLMAQQCGAAKGSPMARAVLHAFLRFSLQGKKSISFDCVSADQVLELSFVGTQVLQILDHHRSSSSGMLALAAKTKIAIGDESQRSSYCDDESQLSAQAEMAAPVTDSEDSIKGMLSLPATDVEYFCEFVQDFSAGMRWRDYIGC